MVKILDTNDTDRCRIFLVRDTESGRLRLHFAGAGEFMPTFSDSGTHEKIGIVPIDLDETMEMIMKVLGLIDDIQASDLTATLLIQDLVALGFKIRGMVDDSEIPLQARPTYND